MLGITTQSYKSKRLGHAQLQELTASAYVHSSNGDS